MKDIPFWKSVRKDGIKAHVPGLLMLSQYEKLEARETTLSVDLFTNRLLQLSSTFAFLNGVNVSKLA